MSREITHFEEKKKEAKINRASETCSAYKHTHPQRLVQHTNTHTVVVPEKKTRKGAEEKIFEEMVKRKLPKSELKTLKNLNKL